MTTASIFLDPELLQIVSAKSGRHASELHPWTHVVFDLGIDGEDIDELVETIEKHFDFEATDDEWRSVGSLGEMSELVGQLRGRHRLDVPAERARAYSIGQRKERLVTLGVIGWCAAGVVASIVSFPVMVSWTLTTLLAVIAWGVRASARSAGARRRWKRERFAKYGV